MNKPHRPKARAAKGFRDIGPDEIRGQRAMLAKIQGVPTGAQDRPKDEVVIESITITES